MLTMWKRLTRTFRQPELAPPQPPSPPPLMAGRVEYLGYEIGAWSYGSPRVLCWGEGTKLQVGKFCSIADGVTILLGGNHRTDWITPTGRLKSESIDSPARDYSSKRDMPLKPSCGAT